MRIQKAVILILALVFPALSHAQGNEPYADFPQQGLLAGQASTASRSVAVTKQLPMGLAGQPVPLLGGLSLDDKRNWNYSVSNETDKKIKLTVEIVEFGADHSGISSRTFTMKLKPKSSDGGKTSAQKAAIGAGLYLKGWSWVE